MRKQSWEFQEVQVAKIRRTKNQRGVSPRVYSCVLLSPCTQRKYPRSKKRTTRKEQKEQFPHLTQGWEPFMFSTTSMEKPCAMWPLLWVREEQSLGCATQRAHRYRLCWSSLTKIKCKHGENRCPHNLTASQNKIQTPNKIRFTMSNLQFKT